MTTRSKVGIFKPKLNNVALVHKEPESIEEAIQNPRWFEAMKGEYSALLKNNTWSLVPRSDGQKIVGNKWVYRVKHNSYRSLAKYKARLVARGFQQIAGVNYFETFSLVLTEEVFMDQPAGFVDSQRPNFVCKPHKSLYGLKQAPRSWSVIGGMQYLVLTRPEITFAVNKLSQYVSSPTMQHLIACKRVLKYLKSTQDYRLKFAQNGEMKITGFTDADLACDLDDRKPVGAYCIYLEIPAIWCDNTSATELAHNLVCHSRTKHIELD
ncbi:retrovirus-related pol polyprotein from transposon RE1 [Citrus sinensis]|nr:retrovirus-related pol polyprotein from transposon RE1 [Citrus sinensis]